MDVIDLPLLDATGAPTTAITRMNEGNCHAVVVRDAEDDFRLLLNVDVLRAWARRLERLADVKVGEFIEPLSEFDDAYEVVRDGLYARYGAIEEALDRARTNWGIGRVWKNDTVSLITRHEPKKEELQNRPTVCVCSSNPRHVNDCPPAQRGTSCFDCTRGTYSCA